MKPNRQISDEARPHGVAVVVTPWPHQGQLYTRKKMAGE